MFTLLGSRVYRTCQFLYLALRQLNQLLLWRLRLQMTFTKDVVCQFSLWTKFLRLITGPVCAQCLKTKVQTAVVKFSSITVRVKEHFREGAYCIIPCSRSKAGGEFQEPPHKGKFSITTSCESREENIIFSMLPLRKVEDWHRVSVQVRQYMY